MKTRVIISLAAVFVFSFLFGKYQDTPDKVVPSLINETKVSRTVEKSKNKNSRMSFNEGTIEDDFDFDSHIEKEDSSGKDTEVFNNSAPTEYAESIKNRENPYEKLAESGFKSKTDSSAYLDQVQSFSKRAQEDASERKVRNFPSRTSRGLKQTTAGFNKGKALRGEPELIDSNPNNSGIEIEPGGSSSDVPEIEIDHTNNPYDKLKDQMENDPGSLPQSDPSKYLEQVEQLSSE